MRTLLHASRIVGAVVLTLLLVGPADVRGGGPASNGANNRQPSDQAAQAPASTDVTLEINLLRNGDFSRLNDGCPAFWLGPAAAGSVLVVPGRPNAGNGVGVKMASVRQDCYLLAGEPYRLSGCLRSDRPCSFKDAGVKVIADSRWQHRWGKDAGTLDQTWQHFEITFTPSASEFGEDCYKTIVYSSKPNTEDALYASDLRLTPLSAAGKRRALESSGAQWRDRYAHGVKKAGPPSPDYRLVWADEFDGNDLDLKKWAHRRGNQSESAACAALDGQGHLVLSVTLSGDQLSYPVIHSEPFFTFTYGYVECRVKLEKVGGFNPAFWMQPAHLWGPRGPAREKACAGGTEIDILEACDLMQTEAISHNLHWGHDPSTGNAPIHLEGGCARRELPNVFDDWHTVGMEWTDKQYVFYIDGIESFRTTQAFIARVPEYLILDVLPYPSKTNPASIAAVKAARGQKARIVLFDYVRVYQKKP